MGKNDENLEETEASKNGLEMNEDTQDIEKSDEEIANENLEKAQNEAKDYLDKYQRSVAEFDNFRKRTMLEKTAMYENGTRDTLEKLLPILDNFERAMLSEEDKNSNMYKGVEMIFNQFLETFNTFGVEEVAVVGDAFDPNIHNAVMHIEDENLGENVVAEVLQKGYSLHDKVIRTAMVKVAN